MPNSTPKLPLNPSLLTSPPLFVGSSLFDSHCHFDFAAFEQYKDQQTTLWQQCQQIGIQQMLIPGVQAKQWHRVQALSEQLEGVYFACGLHPWFLDLSRQADDANTADDLSKLAIQLQHPKCVAIGECGIDGSITATHPIALQQKIFVSQLKIAQALQRPMIIHAHRAHHILQPLLKRYPLSAGGVIHAFSGSLELAQSYLKLGFKLGIGGTITYPRAKKTQNTVAQLPLSCLLLETDAPDMPLYGSQGQRNSPLRLPDVARALQQLRQGAGKKESLDEIYRQTTDNARALFQLI